VEVKEHEGDHLILLYHTQRHCRQNRLGRWTKTPVKNLLAKIVEAEGVSRNGKSFYHLDKAVERSFTITTKIMKLKLKEGRIRFTVWLFGICFTIKEIKSYPKKLTITDAPEMVLRGQCIVCKNQLTCQEEMFMNILTHLKLSPGFMIRNYGYRFWIPCWRTG
jgi:hypothetical protein